MELKFFIQIIFIINLIKISICNDNLRVAYEWKEIDFQYQTARDRQDAIDNKTFVPENVIPVGLEVYKTRLFITLPRWKTGVPASLAYIDIDGKF